MTALQGLEAPRGATTWLPCSAHLRALRHRATGHSIGKETSGCGVDAVRLSHQKAVKAGSVVHFASAVYR